VETGRLTLRDSLIHRAQEFERSIIPRFFKKIIMDVIPGMKPDAEEFLKLFLESDEYKVMAARYSKLWPDGSTQVTTHHGAIVNPTPGEQRTVDAMEVAECTGVYDEVKERRGSSVTEAHSILSNASFRWPRTSPRPIMSTTARTRPGPRRLQRRGN
jgi:hypothetical protein